MNGESNLPNWIPYLAGLVFDIFCIEKAIHILSFITGMTAILSIPINPPGCHENREIKCSLQMCVCVCVFSVCFSIIVVRLKDFMRFF